MLLSGLLVKYLFKETLYDSIPEQLRKAVYVRSVAQEIGVFFLIAGFGLIPLGIFLVVFNSNIFTTAMFAYYWL